MQPIGDFPARAPIGADAQGRPVFASRELLVYLEQMYRRGGGADAPTNMELGQRQDVSEEDIWRQSPDTQEALRGIDELRHELAALRSDRDRLHAEIDALAERIEDMPRLDASLPRRVAEIEDRLN